MNAFIGELEKIAKQTYHPLNPIELSDNDPIINEYANLFHPDGKGLDADKNAVEHYKKILNKFKDHKESRTHPIVPAVIAAGVPSALIAAGKLHKASYAIPAMLGGGAYLMQKNYNDSLSPKGSASTHARKTLSMNDADILKQMKNDRKILKREMED
jgi:hypothetical protein